MSDSDKTPKTPEEVQKEIQSFFKEKFGADFVSFPLGSGPLGASAAPTQKDSEVEEEQIPDEVLHFDMRPSQVKAHLDRYVIGQDEAKKTLSVAVCDHYNHVRRMLDSSDSTVEYVKQNVILLGPTGVGKTYLIRNLAQLIGVPFVKADSTKFSETGYVGGDVEDMVRELFRMADGNITLAEHGIIFLDEIDKISSAENAVQGRDPSGRGVQVALLKLMEDTEVPLRNPMDIGSQFQDMMQMRQGGSRRRSMNTRHILFVVSGAFSGLDEIIRKRLSQQNIGFGSFSMDADVDSPGSILFRATTKDFLDYGFEPEFIGRLPIRCALNDLSEDDLFDILKHSEGSILLQYRESFRGYGIEVAFENSALREISKRAHLEQTGARGLMTVMEGCLRDFKFYLPGTGIEHFAVTERLVRDPEATLREILEDPGKAAEEYGIAAIGEWEDDFAQLHEVRLVLDRDASAMAIGVSNQLGIPVSEHLNNIFGDHCDFLRKILEQSGRKELPVTPHILNKPAEGVGLWLGAKQSSKKADSS